MRLLARSVQWLLASGVLATCGVVAGCSEAQSSAAKAPIERPQYLLPDVASFDAGSIAPYNADHAAVYQYIDENQEEHLSALQRWLRQPSISAQNVGINEMAEMVRGDLAAIGFQETALVETDGHPGVWGYFDAGAEKTLMVYMMYDVQPVNEADWRSPPFEAKLVDHELGTALMARGATNQKGPQRAFLNALESILAVEGKLPVNLMITAEGEEELGSPHYPQIVDAYADRLATAEGVIFPFNSQQADGSVNMILGVKGIVYFEAEAQGGDWGGPAEAEIHGSYKAIVDSPVWRLVKALSTLVSEDGNTILVPGFYDGVRPPTEEEASLLSGIAASRDDAAQRKLFKVARWIDDIEGEEALKELTYSPTLNIDGIYGGYTGVGVKTILPHKATAKMDSRLPYGLDPDEALAKIRAHLDEHGGHQADQAIRLPRVADFSVLTTCARGNFRLQQVRRNTETQPTNCRQCTLLSIHRAPAVANDSGRVRVWHRRPRAQRNYAGTTERQQRRGWPRGHRKKLRRHTVCAGRCV